MKPYLPIQHRPPNKFIEYKTIDRGEYVEREANYLDSKGNIKTATAQILWKEEPFT